MLDFVTQFDYNIVTGWGRGHAIAHLKKVFRMGTKKEGLPLPFLIC